MFAFLNRNLWLLLGGQMVFVSGSVFFVTVGGIVGHELAADPGLATLPIALMVVGTASATVPAALTMQRYGRRMGFLLATAIAASGAWLATVALQASSFWLFCGATGLLGMSLGFSQQFRFAAAESVSLDKVSHAISFILLGSIAGAFSGPEVVAASVAADPEAPYTLGFMTLIVLYGFGALLMLGLRDNVSLHEENKDPGKTANFRKVISQPVFVIAVLAGVVGHGVMTYIMTATPISMKVGDGFSMQATAEVVRAHVVAMYLPSLFTPWLIARLGLPRVMMFGVFAMSGALGIGLSGHHMMHYWLALVLIGVGWNFLFVAGTTLLVQSYHPRERFKAQAFNDFSVFGSSALASLLAGSILHLLGWTSLLISAIPVLFLMLGAIIWLMRSKRLK